MKPQHAPDVPGDNSWDKLDSAVRKAFSVSKEELQRRTRRAAKLATAPRPKVRKATT